MGRVCGDQLDVPPLTNGLYLLEVIVDGKAAQQPSVKN